MTNWDSYLEPPWVNDREWTETGLLECENEVDSHPEGVACNDSCAPEDGNHLCGFSGDVEYECVGQMTYSAYYECPQCGYQDYLEKDNYTE